MQNQNLQQIFTGTNVQVTNTTWIHLARNGHMINRLADTLKHKHYCLPKQFSNKQPQLC